MKLVIGQVNNRHRLAGAQKETSANIEHLFRVTKLLLDQVGFFQLYELRTASIVLVVLVGTCLDELEKFKTPSDLILLRSQYDFFVKSFELEF